MCRHGVDQLGRLALGKRRLDRLLQRVGQHALVVGDHAADVGVEATELIERPA